MIGSSPKLVWRGFVIAALLLQLGGVPSVACAQYPDAPDLPGIMSTEDVILIGLGVAVVLVAVILITKNSSADEPEEAEEGEGDKDGSDKEEWESTLPSSAGGRHQVALGGLTEPDVSRLMAEDEGPISMCLRLHKAGDDSADGGVALGISVAF